MKLVFALLMLCFTQTAFADEMYEAEIIMMIDASNSTQFNPTSIGGLSHNKLELQRDGHITALRDPIARQGLIDWRVYLRIVLWSESKKNVQEVFARQIRSAVDLEDAIIALAAIKPAKKKQINGGTSHLMMLDHALSLPKVARRRIVDVSTDDAPRDTMVDWVAKRRSKLDPSTTVNVLVIDDSEDGWVRKTLEECLKTSDGRMFDGKSWSEYTELLIQKLRYEVALGSHDMK